MEGRIPEIEIQILKAGAPWRVGIGRWTGGRGKAAVVIGTQQAEASGTGVAHWPA